ncbi:MAG: DUF3644 domain-containing protein [Thermoplasmata archaeon]|nr:DUF3644 domain-containing protein [Thermoplasmata archaeon]
MRLPRQSLELLEKARHSALLAVETYNRPAAPFRTHGYIVLMQIAWTALLHAVFARDKVKPYYRGKRRRFILIDGEPKRWELDECVNRHWQGKETPVTRNLRFIIGLRNKIEHRNLPELDLHVLGECQSMLFNFESLLEQEFGPKFAINESLVVPLQLSRLRAAHSSEALRQLIKPLPGDLGKWVDTFRTSLTQDEYDSPEFSFRILLIPELKNNLSRDSLSVRFISYEPGKSPEVDHAIAMIKRSQLPIVNQGLVKPWQVVAEVQKRIGTSVKMTMAVHTQCWRFYGVRPSSDDDHPENCHTNHCVYDRAHEDYVYTKEWIDFLVSELSRPGKLVEIMSWVKPPPAAPAAPPPLPPGAP